MALLCKTTLLPQQNFKERWLKECPQILYVLLVLSLTTILVFFHPIDLICSSGIPAHAFPLFSKLAEMQQLEHLLQLEQGEHVKRTRHARGHDVR